MAERTREELEALLAKIAGMEGQTERADDIRQRLAAMPEPEE